MGSLTKTTRAILALFSSKKDLRQVRKPSPLPPIMSLQTFLTGAYTAEKTKLEPSSMVINGFTLRNKEAALSIIMIDRDRNNHYAHINDTRMDYSGSLVKVAAVYAAYDLRCAARQHAKNHSFSDQVSFFNSFTATIDTSTAIQPLKDFGKGLKPDLNKIFVGFRATEPNKMQFTTDFRDDLDNILENPNAGRIIRALGYSYINVSMIRGRFFDPDPTKLNGIWLAGDYSGESILKSVRVPVENDTVPKGSGQAITMKEMSRMFYLIHTQTGLSHVTDSAERADANLEMHQDLKAQGAFFFDTQENRYIHLTAIPDRFSKDCAKVGVGVLGPIGGNGPAVFSEGTVMKWTNVTEVTDFNKNYRRNLTGDFVLCWQNMYKPDSHFDALVRIINTAIRNFLTQ